MTDLESAAKVQTYAGFTHDFLEKGDIFNAVHCMHETTKHYMRINFYSLDTLASRARNQVVALKEREGKTYAFPALIQQACFEGCNTLEQILNWLYENNHLEEKPDHDGKKIRLDKDGTTRTFNTIYRALKKYKGI